MREFPTLRSERLLLRELAPADAAALYALRGDPRVVRYTGVPLYTGPAEAMEYVKRVAGGWRTGESYTWALCRREIPGEMIGDICLWNPSPAGDAYDIGYELLPAYQGAGYMTEAGKTLTEWAFSSLRLAAILADPRVENAASVSLLKRLGFREAGEKREADGCHLLLRLENPGRKKR